MNTTRRAETEQLRTARRDSLSILLSRAQRGVLSRAEAALLRTHVEAELAEADAAIRELEQRAEEAEQRLARIRAALDEPEQEQPR